MKRWGDYSGAQRKYNTPGVVWACGTYGRVNRSYGTWIAEIFNPEVFVGRQSETNHRNDISVYPNPVVDQVSVAFFLEESAFTEVFLYDLNGNLVHTFIRDRIKKGQNLFSFTTNSLSSGSYIFTVRSGEKEIMSKQLIVQK